MKTAAQKRDFCAGLLLVFAGLGAALDSRNNAIGTLAHMGAGYFPFVLGLMLAGVGVIIAAASFSSRSVEGEAAAAVHLPDLRGCSAIILGLLAFIGLGYRFGLAPAVFSCVFISALGDRASTVRGSLVLAAGLTVFSVVLFVYALKVPFPIVK